MRQEGRITRWNDDKGFGFIAPAGGGDPVFLHIKAFVRRDKRPAANEVVTYELQFDERKRARADKVAFAHQRIQPLAKSRQGTATPSAPPDRAAFPVCVAAVFFAYLAWSTATGKLHFAIIVLYALASLFAFLAYGRDKGNAERHKRRTPEVKLHLISMLGGWPGAWIAQRVFRHKSKKTEFQITFAATLIVNCIALAYVTLHFGSNLPTFFAPFLR